MLIAQDVKGNKLYQKENILYIETVSKQQNAIGKLTETKGKKFYEKQVKDSSIFNYNNTPHFSISCMVLNLMAEQDEIIYNKKYKLTKEEVLRKGKLFSFKGKSEDQYIVPIDSWNYIV